MNIFEMALNTEVKKPRRSQREIDPTSIVSLMTHRQGFDLRTATHTQQAVWRIIENSKLGVAQVGPAGKVLYGPDHGKLERGRFFPQGEYAREVYLLSGIRTGKSMTAAALALRATQVVDLSSLSVGEEARVAVLSIRKDLAKVIYNHLLGLIKNSPKLCALLVGEPTTESIRLRQESSARTVEIRIVAGARAGASVVGRWLAGLIFDEAPRMVGGDDGVVNLEDTRKAGIERLLPGAQIMYLGSPWAPMGPVYAAVQEFWMKPNRDVVIMRAPAPVMNPVFWDKERIERVKRLTPDVYRTDVLGEFVDFESALLMDDELKAVTRDDNVRLEYDPQLHYVAAMDPGTRSNGWPFAIAALDGDFVRKVVMAQEFLPQQGSPLNPRTVMRSIAKECARYKVPYILTDQYSADAMRVISEEEGLPIHCIDINARNKLQMFDNLRIYVQEKRTELPKNDVMLTDLKRVRKRVTQDGVRIHLPHTNDGRHCDYAAALALLLGAPLPARDLDLVPPPDGWTREEHDEMEAFEEELRRESGENDDFEYQDEGDVYEYA